MTRLIGHFRSPPRAYCVSGMSNCAAVIKSVFVFVFTFNPRINYSSCWCWEAWSISPLALSDMPSCST